MTKPVLGVLKKSSFWSKANANTGNTTSSIAVKSAFPENKALEPKKIQSNPLSPFNDDGSVKISQNSESKSKNNKSEAEKSTDTKLKKVLIKETIKTVKKKKIKILEGNIDKAKRRRKILNSL